MCRDVAWQLVQLAERTAEYRSRTGANPPMNEFRRWVAMFIAGDPALGSPIVQVRSHSTASLCMQRAGVCVRWRL